MSSRANTQRSFVDLSQSDESTNSNIPQNVSETDELVLDVQKSLIGDDHAIPGPIGPRKISYFDHTASGRASRLIEDVIQTTILPYYANTHTGTSYTGFSSHCFFDEARTIIRDSVRAIEKDDVVLFVPKGATAASQRLVHFMKMNASSNAVANQDNVSPGNNLLPCTFPGCTRKFESTSSLIIHARTHPDGEWSSWTGRANSSKASGSSVSDPESPGFDTPRQQEANLIVIVGPHAHHSSFLPWKEAGATLVHIPPPEQGSPWQRHYGIDMVHLALTLASARKNNPSQILGIFTHGSNVTGSMLSMPHVTALLHAFGAFAIWDCAASAPHLRLDMNPREELTLSKIFERVDQSMWKDSLDQVRNELVTCTPPDFFDMYKGAINPSASNVPRELTWNACVDALYFSCHKFIGGGAGTPGVLVLKRFLIQSSVPYTPGGGTVFYVTAEGTPLYLGNDTEREEAGTPDVVASVRAGLCFHLLRSIGWDNVANREMAMFYLARDRLSRHPNIRIVGNGGMDNENLPILSFVVLARSLNRSVGTKDVANNGNTRLHNAMDGPIVGHLHWNFVCAVLNDLFGIQARGGCLCAGVYSHELLNITEDKSQTLQKLLVENKEESLRPGFIRISFSVTTSQQAFAYIVMAIEWIATYAHQLLKYYTLVPDTGEWRPQRAKMNTLLGHAYKRRYGQDVAKLPPFQILGNSDTQAKELNAVVDTSSEQPPRAVIRNLTFSKNGNIEKAQRGNYQPHPRIWLQSIKFRPQDSSSNTLVDHSIFVRLPESSDKGSYASSEAALYAAYLSEANMLMEEILENTDPKDRTATSHLNASNILSEEAQGLRWFALWQDFVALFESDDCGKDATSQCLVPWDLTSNLVAIKVETEATKSPMQRDDTSVAYSSELPALRSALQTLENNLPPEYTGQLGSVNKTSSGVMDAEVGTIESNRTRQNQESNEKVYDTSTETVASEPATPQKRNLTDDSDATQGNESTKDSGVEFVCPLRPTKREKRETVKTRNIPSKKRKSMDMSNEEAQALLEKVQTYISSKTRSLPDVDSGLDDNPDSDQDFTESAIRLIRKASQVGSQGIKRTVSQLTPEEYKFRIKRLELTTAALKRITGSPGPPKQVLRSISRAMGSAIREFDMIQNGDRILVGLSGGKDSMTLLLELLRLQAIAPVWFEVAAATVDPMYEGYDPSPLREWCKSLNIPYFFESQPIMDQAAESMGKDSICSFCSRMKRGVLYTTCRREGYNVLALGQHLDDFAESFVMSAFRNGSLRTMKAHYMNDDKDVRIIRPLVYVRERHTRDYAYNCKLPIIAENCPACFTGPTVRDKTKRLLAAEEAVNQNLFASLQLAMKPLMLTKGQSAVALSLIGPPVSKEVLRAAPKNFVKTTLHTQEA